MKQPLLPQAYITKLIVDVLGDTPHPPIELETKSPRDSFGDFSSTIAFLLAPTLQKSPRDIAQELISRIHEDPYIEKIDIAGNGFINFFVKPQLFIDTFPRLEKKHLASYIRTPHSKKIIIEFSSPNVAKPLSVGHMRNTLLGEFLARLHERVGHRVIRWNHLGDWGTQFGKLLFAYKTWGDQKKVSAHPITELLALYVRFTKEAHEQPTLEDAARKEFYKLEQGDLINKKLLAWFLKETIKELSVFYAQMGISFDMLKGESFYIPFKERFFKKLEQAGLMRKSEGADIIPLDGMPPVLLRKSDGATLYHTRDLLSLQYRIKKYHPDMIFYVVGNEQLLYLSQLFAAAKIIGITGPDLVHVSYGLVFGPGKKKFSTREGTVITAHEIIRDTLFKAAALMHEKYPDVHDRPHARVIESVALGAIKYNLLKESRTSEVIFDFDKMLSFTGNSAPYLQYTFARVNSLLKKSGGLRTSLFKKPSLSHCDETDYALIQKALAYPDVLQTCVRTLSSHPLTDYLFSFANELNSFYEKNPIIKDGDVLRKKQRLYMLSVCADILKDGLWLLGIDSPKQI